MIKRQGKGSGTIRRQRFDLIALRQIKCEHLCIKCGKKFSHKADWGTHLMEWQWQDLSQGKADCHIWFVVSHIPCTSCMEIDMFDSKTGKRYILT